MGGELDNWCPSPSMSGQQVLDLLMLVVGPGVMAHCWVDTLNILLLVA